MWLFLCLCSLVAFLFFGLSMAKHRNHLGLPPLTYSKERVYRAIGWMGLVAGLYCALISKDSAIGVLNWLGTLTVASLTVALFFSFTTLPSHRSRKTKK